MIASESAPLAQVGGIADVLRALPGALQGFGFAVRRFLPAYGGVDRSGFAREPGNTAVPLGPARVPVRWLTRAEPDGVLTTLVECEELFARDGVYGPPGGAWPDNARRFALLSRAVCERARAAATPPAILHAHDWHTALVPLFARAAPGGPAGPRSGRPAAPRTVLTIHNMGYQGRFGAGEIDWLTPARAERARLLGADGIEDHGGINFLKAGLLHADAMTAVSPTYAREIQTPEGGSGLHELARHRADRLTGILNGADYAVWDPAVDRFIERRYDTASLAEGKADAATGLRRRLGLRPQGGALIGVVGRLARQKGIDLLAGAAPALLEAGADLAILGSGDADIVESLAALQRAQPDRIGLQVGFDEELSHRIVAGSDIILVPSVYEPCGLVQMYGLRYGTIPVVRRTGGLADTVRDERAAAGRGTGFLFDDIAPAALAAAARAALDMKRADPQGWRALQGRAMAEDFSWARAAASYADLYRKLLAPISSGGL
jgi:starch synthase